MSGRVMRRWWVVGLMWVVGPVALASADDTTPPGTVAVFALRGAITEAPQADDLLFGSMGGETLKDLVARIDKASADKEVKAAVILFESASLGRSQIEEIRQAMDRFKAAGKDIYANVDGLSTGTYSLLSGANKLTVVPTGDVFITGMYGESLHLRGLLDKLNVKPDYFTCGAYKAAAELFMRTAPSKEAQENMDWLMDGEFQSVVRLIAEGRKVPEQRVREWIDTGLYSAERAKAAGIIDDVQYRQDFLADIQSRYGEKAKLDRKYGKKTAGQIDFSSPLGILKFYAELIAGPQVHKSTKDAVAIVYVEGPILPGEGQSSPLAGLSGGMAYSTPIRKALDQAAADPTIKAVVLRVNSPGGSAVASEIILDATKRVKAKKPFVVSMGDVAGSGGYYVACGADTIFADHSTITGSIGVVMGKLATRGLWERVGINWSPIQRGKMAGALQSGDVFTDDERQQLKDWMNEVYEIFKGHVVAIRGPRLKKDIESMAGGRVYTGDQALELGLIDRIGSLHDAIGFIAAQAKVKDYEIRVLPRPKNFIEMLMSDMGGNKDDEGPPIRLHRNTGSIGLVHAALPYVEGLEPERLRSVLGALQMLECLQQERVMLTMPVIQIRD